MFATKKHTGRFSLLLLEENEFYVKDFVATCVWPTDVSGNWHQGTAPLSGQLRLCTKSIFFEPDDVRVPIVRLPFQHLEQLEGLGRQEISLISRQLHKMKANAADEPYVFEKHRLTTWKFKLSYAILADFMPLAQRMLVASRLPPADHEALIQEVLTEVEGALRFDSGHLRSPSLENILLEVSAMRLAPLVKEPCLLVITNLRLYMQPLHNISGDTAVRSHPLSEIAAVARRRSGLKDIGLEIFFVNPAKSSGPVWGSASAFFSFKNQTDRQTFLEALTSQTSLGEGLPGGKSTAAACGSVLEAGGGWLARVTVAWQHGRLSNFDYLLYCNLAAGRSFNDLTQYPVFPWVLQDYFSAVLDLNDPGIFRDLSKPIGALNAARLAQFKSRYTELAAMHAEHDGMDPPFLYGTHYSCPGYSMFWLVRAAPAHMLRLQSGKFDAPDRLFCSISEAWSSVLTNPADVKELIPEFYMPERPDFLVNSKRLALGVRQDHRAVGDVELPPWAYGSAERFLEVQRAAVESPFVSANLHHWIDLIFGIKQRGSAAVEADNVFRHLTYEGAIDPEAITDRIQREAIEVAINEFGQCPRQIFHNPHPSRLVCPPPPELSSSPRVGKAIDGGASSRSLSLALVSAIIATLEDEEEHRKNDAVEVPALLRQLDVAAHRPPPPPPPNKDTQSSPPSNSANSNNSKEVTQQQQQRQAASPFASAKAGIMGKLGSFKDAISSEARRKSGVLTTTNEDSTSNASSSGGLGFSAARLASSLSTRWAPATGSASRKSIDQPIAPPRKESNPHPNTPEDSFVGASSVSVAVQEEEKRGGDGELPAIFWKKTKCPAATESSADIYDTSGHHQGSSSSVLIDQSSIEVEGPVLTATAGITKEEEKEEEHFEWVPGLRDRLKPGATFVAGSEGINALDLAFADGNPCVYSAGHDGSIRVFNAATGLQIRSAHLGGGSQPLTSLALLPFPTTSRQQHPLVLCGSYDGNIYAYKSYTGTVAGKFVPHGDVVSCIALSQNCTTNEKEGLLASASWDCSVKVWSLAEGRQPWDSTLPQPVVSIEDLPGGVWALALSSCGKYSLIGTEEGQIAFLDFRQPSYSAIAWQQEIGGQDYVGGLTLLPGNNHAIAACANGTLALLDCRKNGKIVSTVSCGSSLRCCASDGAVAVVGAESGSLLFWDIGQQLERPPAAGVMYTTPGLDGMYPPLTAEPASPVNAVAVAAEMDKNNKLCLATGHDGGVVRVYWDDK